MSTVPAASASLSSIQIQGDVHGSTIVFGDNNFAVNTNHGTIVYQAPRSKVSRLGLRPPTPRSPLVFLDRASELQQASGFLSSYQQVVLHGLAGAGKTTLIKQIANLLPAEQFPDGVVFVDGEWDALSAGGLDGVVQSVFDALFESDPPLKVSLSTARTYLGSVKPLILLDHLDLPREAWRKLPDLFPAGGLLWSMANIPPAQGAHELPLSGLPPDESRQLLIRVSGLNEAEADPAILQQICERLDYLPLAIVTTGNWLRAQRISLAEALVMIPARSSSEKNADERAFAAILASLTRPEAEILSLVAAAGGPLLERSTLAQASTSEPTEAQAAISTFEVAGLLLADGPAVGLHPAHKALARKLLPANDLLLSSLAGVILRYAIARQSVPELVRSQLGNLLGVLDYSLQSGKIEQAAIAARLVVPQLVLSGKWDLWRQTCQRMLDAARLGGDQAQVSRALHELGTHQLATGNPAEAASLLTQARDLRLQTGDTVGAAYTQHNLNHLQVPPPAGQPPGPKESSPISRRPNWLRIGGIALLSIVVLGAFYFFRRPPPEQPLALAPAVASTTQPGPEAILPAVSQDNTSTPTGTSTLTPTGTISRSPIPTDTPTPTATITPSPTHTFTPTSTATRPPPPTAAPSGFIVFASERGNRPNELYYRWADGSGSVERLTEISGNDSRPDLPRRGNRIAFTHVEDGYMVIYYYYQGEVHGIDFPVGGDMNQPDWSRDGSRIAYQAGEGDGIEIWVLQVQNPSQPVQLTKNNQRDFCPDWSPDGSQIAFSRDMGGGNVDIYVMDADGSDARPLTNDHPGVDRCPTWSPDGRLIAFESNRGTGQDIWVMNADGSDPQQLTDHSPVEAPAAWSPDGNWLAFTTEVTGNWNIYLVSLDGRTLRELIAGGSDDVFPAWVDELNLDVEIIRYDPIN